MPFSDKETQKEYQREWMRKRRLKWIGLMGGVCVNCGATADLEIDHVDPTLKISHRIWSWNEERIKSELKKCQLLCVECHKVKSAIDRAPSHGTDTMYGYGCRCDDCKLARKIVKAANRKRRKAAGLPYQ